MAQAKTIFIIPGFRQKATSKAYKQISKILKNEGYSPILISIPWKNSTISQNTDYFLKAYKKINARKKYILGFSYGAMIAFIASTRVSSSGLILCSMSPYFNEDVSRNDNKAISFLSEARYQDFSKLHYAALAKKIKAKQILMLYGRQEARSLIKRVTEAFLEIESADKHLLPIKKVEHNIADKRYLFTISQAARSLL